MSKRVLVIESCGECSYFYQNEDRSGECLKMSKFIPYEAKTKDWPILKECPLPDQTAHGKSYARIYAENIALKKRIKKAHIMIEDLKRNIKEGRLR